MIKLLIISFLIDNINCFNEVNIELNLTDLEWHIGRLYLTPFIDSNDIDKARRLAEVRPYYDNVISYSGYLTINKTSNTNILFWYFKSENREKDAPVIFYLQGNPTMSSLWGVFEENGPYVIDHINDVILRKWRWTRDHHVVYIENNIGTGFSFTDGDTFCIDFECIGNNLYEVVKQFYKLFPELIKNDLYIVSSATGCKDAFSLGYAIDKDGNKFNLKGIAISGGFCDPANQIDYADYYYQLGLIDDKFKNEMEIRTKNITDLIREQKWIDAYLAKSCLDHKFKNLTGFTTTMSILNTEIEYYKEPILKFLKYVLLETFRDRIHAGEVCSFSFGADGRSYVEELFLQSIAPLIEMLLNKYKILFYNGQLDMVTNYSNSVNFIGKLNWCGSKDYLNAVRKIWRAHSDKIAGYYKNISPINCNGSLAEVLIRNAGQEISRDKPAWENKLIYLFTHFSHFESIY